MPKPLKRIENAEFYDLLGKASAFEAIIKGAIAIEAEMEALFELAFFDSAALAEIGLTYSQKATLLIAIGLQPRYAPPLRALAKMRNKFAHTLDRGGVFRLRRRQFLLFIRQRRSRDHRYDAGQYAEQQG